MISFTLPAPPGVNTLYANVPGKGRVKTKRYRAWIKEAGWVMRVSPNGTLNHWTPITGPVNVTILGGNARQDNDAGVKAIFDLMTRMRVWLDDAQVREHTVSHGGLRAKTIVTIIPLGP